MSFLAGVFGAGGETQSSTSPELRAAFRLDLASVWSAGAEGFLAHIQSIVTPEDREDRLPLSFCSGRKVLALDGRLDNRDELINQLNLRSRLPLGDGAILAAAIEHWDEDVCCHLIGDFAFAVWDKAQRKLHLACDQTGGRSLFYSLQGSRIIFATTLDAVLHFPGISREIDLASVANVLCDLAPERGATLFKAVSQVPAATSLFWSGGQVSLTRYWSPERVAPLRFARDEDYVERGRELLNQAVTCRLRAIDPVVCQLSGGLDSSGVAATAARLLAPERLLTVTASPQEGVQVPQNLTSRAFTDEWPYAAQVAAMHPNIVAHRARAAPPSLEDPHILFHARGRPVRNFMNVSWFGAAEEIVRQLGSSVVLSGASGNLTLSWTGSRRLADLARSFHWIELGRELGALHRRGRGALRFLRADVGAVLPLALRQQIKKWRGTPTTSGFHTAVNPSFVREAGLESLIARNGTRIDGLDYDRSMRLHMLDQMWRRQPAAAMRAFHGYEIRDPLGDIRLMEFCFAIPSNQFLRAGVTRFLARRVLADRLPQQILAETGIGRQSPEWFHRMNFARDYLLAEVERLQRSPLAGSILDFGKMWTIAADWPADADAAAHRFIPLMWGLARGVNLAQFFEWVEAGCPRPEGAGLPGLNLVKTNVSRA